MRVITCLLLVLFTSSAFLGVCSGTVWFEGYNPQEPQELRLKMLPIDNTSASLPTCYLHLNETQPKLFNLTIIVSTAALFYQTVNFETWLSIDSQEPQKLVGLFDWEGLPTGDSPILLSIDRLIHHLTSLLMLYSRLFVYVAQ